MIDLRSDTVTRPSSEMREAALDADVGDDVYGEDPSVNELEAHAADLVGMEAALYVPTGTMGNHIAARVHTERGQEVLVECDSHIYTFELGGLAQHSQLQVRTYDGGENGCPTPQQIHEGFVTEDLHRPGTGLVCVENTHNVKGGVTVSGDELSAAADAAHDLGVPMHVDGARVHNAAIALDIAPDELLAPVDSVMFCLSKGLGGPVGSMLAGPESFIEQARRTRKLMGGGMRQAGMIAAPGLLALENRERLAVDHANAALLADKLDEIPGLNVPDPETNIVLVNTDEAGLTAAEFLERARSEGVLGTKFGEYTVRFCTHLDVNEDDIYDATEVIERAI